MAVNVGTASGHEQPGSPYADEAGRPIGEYQPSALERLNHLHNESVETARLANLWGRVPLAAAALAFGAVGVVLFSAGSAPPVMLGLWALFVAAAVAVMLRVRRQAANSSFELLPLRAFALDLNAVMLYAGFAWGAGAFLGLPAPAGAVEPALLSLGGAAAIGLALRARGATLYFLVPNIAIAACGAFLAAANVEVAFGILLSGLVAAGAIELAERHASRRAYNSDPQFLTLR